MLWRLASAWGNAPAKNSWTTCRLNSIECVRCLAMGFLLESPGQLADSQVPYLSTPRGALHRLSLSIRILPDLHYQTDAELRLSRSAALTATNGTPPVHRRTKHRLQPAHRHSPVHSF